MVPTQVDTRRKGSLLLAFNVSDSATTPDPTPGINLPAKYMKGPTVEQFASEI